MSSDLQTALHLLTVYNDLVVYLGLLIVCIGTIGNLLNCFAFICIPALNKHPNALFVIGASIGSLVFITTGIIPAVLKVRNGIILGNQWLFWCKLNVWLTYSSGCFSYLCFVLTALGQYLITSRRVKWQRFITRFRAQLIITFSAIFWLCIFIPYPIYYNHVSTPSTTPTCQLTNPKINTYSTYSMTIGYYIFPIVSILILFCLTACNLKQLLRGHRRRLEGAVTRMMLTQMSIILASGIPAAICVIYMLVTQNYSKSFLRMVCEYVASLVFNLFVFLTNGSSFWVYLFASKIFRKHLRDYLLKCNLFRRRIMPLFHTATATTNVNHNT